MTAPELKPCPFCGGRPYLANKEMPGGAFVVCTDCRAATDDDCIDATISRWNTRADLPPTLSAALDLPEIKALVGALRQCVDHCRNSGRGNALVNDRIYERVEETATNALRGIEGQWWKE